MPVLAARAVVEPPSSPLSESLERLRQSARMRSQPAGAALQADSPGSPADGTSSSNDYCHSAPIRDYVAAPRPIRMLQASAERPPISAAGPSRRLEEAAAPGSARERFSVPKRAFSQLRKLIAG